MNQEQINKKRLDLLSQKIAASKQFHDALTPDAKRRAAAELARVELELSRLLKL